ncbi:MAG: CBS domain-containing protein [Isosphaeraceae bacterium]|nr:CBS domain-containing protein [Isosphaeraceae bacterium]
MRVRDVLQRKGNRIITIRSDARVDEAIALLVRNDIGSLPVLDAEGRMIGVISERDVLRLYHVHGDAFGRLAVETVMTRNPAACSALDDVEEVMGLMSERRIAKVPVVEGEKLVGIVSVGDVIKAMYDAARDENSRLYDYVHGIA